MYLLYSALLVVWFVATLPYWLIQMGRHGKYRAGLAQRLGRVPHNLAISGATVWVHAVSVGEVLAVSHLVSRLNDEFPNLQVLVSTTTETGQKLARKRFGPDRVFYCPVDLGFAIRPYLQRLRPKLLVLAETEFWPNLLRLSRQQGAHIAVVNGRISDRSLPGYRRIRGWLKRVLAQVDCFLVQSESDKQRLIIIGACPDRVQVTGNLKFDVEPPRPPSIVSSLSAAFTDSAAHPILVCGSTVEGEEPLLLQAFQNVLASYPRAIMILAPRHPERFPEVAKLLEKFGIRVWQRSLWSGDPIFGGVLLLDTIGELAALYSLATVAFVGGSLVPRGGHSIIEPAQYGVPIIVGNHTENFRDVVALFQSRNAIRVVGPAELPLAFMELIGDEQARARLGSNATITLRSQQGATERTLVALSRFLAGPSGNTKSGNHACEPAQP